jgi:hypothetical protein
MRIGYARVSTRDQHPDSRGKTLFASARKLIPQVIGEAFAEAYRRDPGHARPRPAVVDGNNVRPESHHAQRALIPSASDRMSNADASLGLALADVHRAMADAAGIGPACEVPELVQSI